MARYFFEVAYNGAAYAGFQIQENANTIQAELEQALQVFYKQKIELTGSSRTDAGVHALQNFFHADIEQFNFDKQHVYNINALLPADIVLKNITQVANDMHCRFNALSRSYEYRVYQQKNPFFINNAFFYPFPLNLELLQKAAALLKTHQHFETFSKKHTQVNNFNCTILISEWEQYGDLLIYKVEGNRFLRGMVRGLVATMLRVGTSKISLEKLNDIVLSNDNKQAFFDAPAHGLYLQNVNFP
jgi:tRNA pseudouridine38-40 synthase